MDVPAIVKKVLEVTGLKQTALGKKSGVSQGAISKWMNGEQSPNLDQWERLVALASQYPALRNLVKGIPFSSGVAIEGHIGAGAEIGPAYEQIPPEGVEQVDLPFTVSSDMIAYRVKGDSMLPVYRDGDVVLVWREPSNNPEQYFGEDVAIETQEGQRYIKELQPGQRKGLFNLSSHNAKLIKDVRLETVREIYLTIKNNQVRKTRSKSERRASAKR